MRRYALLALLGLSSAAEATGTWTPLTNDAPEGIQMLLLLPDGSVMAQHDNSKNWYRLTPDAYGSYTNGTWSALAQMNESRLFYSSVVLPNGRVFVAGGEYGSNGTTNSTQDGTKPLDEYLATAEMYDPVTNVWTRLPAVPSTWSNSSNAPNGSFAFGDSMATLISTGNILIGPVYHNGGRCVIYDVANNAWINGPQYFNSANQNEATWLKLPDDSILSVPTNSTASQRYSPATNTWTADGTVPVNLYSAFGSETGAALMLPDGRGFWIGGSNKTAYYTPGQPLASRWSAGPDIPSDPAGNPQGAPDAAAAMLTNGKILMAVSRAPYMPASGTAVVFSKPTRFYEFDPVANIYTGISGPTGATENHECYKTIMLALPDGRILYSNYGAKLYVYTPDGTPVPQGKPAIQSLTPNGDGTWHLTGTGLNGFCTGASYGDDAQMDTNYPLVRLTAGTGQVYYARTYNWSSNSVATGNRVLSTEFTLPETVLAGNYSLQVVANGIASDPVPFAGPVWVDFAFAGPLQIGTFSLPFQPLVTGVGTATPGGHIYMKAPRSMASGILIDKPVTLHAVGGSVVIGQ